MSKGSVVSIGADFYGAKSNYPSRNVHTAILKLKPKETRPANCGAHYEKCKQLEQPEGQFEELGKREKKREQRKHQQKKLEERSR